MIESISAITLATHDMSRAVRFYRTLGFEIAYGVRTQRLRAFELEQVISISLPNQSSGIGPGGDVLSFTTRTLTLSMRT
jgi:catechol 2,3-dioxygenase-like lactoylglutathione lyase family enzyme